MKSLQLDATILQVCIDRYGIDSQTDVAIEEMSELIKALIKYRRRASVKTLQNIEEEIADVSIMLSQLVMIYSNAEEIQKQIDQKLARQIVRLGLPEDSE